eukprot:TRINITY_DN10066_c0_g1_i1.p1 TRINITY_DN10066_c0_g1~~TRINITY_DN10066_c0_g1_i1.p1  ORF type:complete len:596 (+),score=167.10 TRINITY_DN10066_c0_g1_i1:89-1876(+)
MGFGVADVLSDDSHTSEFICKICNDLVEWAAVTYTSCTHVFCTSCLDMWFSQGKRRCPCCQTGLGSNQVGVLRLANPLANRLLGRVKVRCPLHCTESGCKWSGEYSELQSHLTMSDSHTPEDREKVLSGGRGSSDSIADAQALKEQGNAKFQARAYDDAITLYSKAHRLAPGEPMFLLNRAAALLMKARWHDCAKDCEAALALDPSLCKAYTRLARARMEQGDFSGAVSTLRRGAEESPGNESVRAELVKAVDVRQWMEEGEAALEAGKPSLAAQFYATAAKATDNSSCVMLRLSQAELQLGRSDSVLRLTQDILKADRSNVLAFRVRSEALMLSNDVEQALVCAQEALRQDPDEAASKTLLKRVRKVREAATRGRELAFKRQFEDAERVLGDAIAAASAPQRSPLCAELHADRAAARHRLGQHEAALKDCAVAIYARDDCRSAWLTRAGVLLSLGRHEEVRDEMSGLLKKGFEQDEAVRSMYFKADFNIRKAARPDYYGVLGVGKLASESEIRGGYKKRALEVHPDKVDPDAPAEFKAKADEEFRQMGDALEILTNDFKRKLWDEGYDKAAIEERAQAAERAARKHQSRTPHAH